MGVRWLIPIVAVFFVLTLINLIRKRQLLEAHALLWRTKVKRTMRMRGETIAHDAIFRRRGRGSRDVP